MKKCQLVEVLDQGLNNWLVLTLLPSAPGDLEDEGFLPAHDLQPPSKWELVEVYVSLHHNVYIRSIVPNTVIIAHAETCVPFGLYCSGCFRSLIKDWFQYRTSHITWPEECQVTRVRDHMMLDHLMPLALRGVDIFTTGVYVEICIIVIVPSRRNHISLPPSPSLNLS